MKVLTVVGARPQFVKSFPVSRALRDRHEEVLVHTGQHYDEELSEVFFEELGIPQPDYNLGVGSHSHAVQTGTMMAGLEELVRDERPDLVLTYGDTNSTLAAAVTVGKMDPALAHVEAGLRLDDRTIPEEVNRVVTDHLSDLLFAPTERAVDNLEREGITAGVSNTGDVMYDALLWARERVSAESTVLDDLGLDEGEYVLATAHRARNTDERDRLESIVDALDRYPGTVLLPAHPRTVKRLREYGLYDRATESLRVIEPVGYLDFVRLLDAASRVVTDSGGVQKEAFFLDVPCITLREETEWPETVDHGGNVLVGADADAILRAMERPPRPVGDRPSPFGDGTAATNVVDAITDSAGRS